MVAFFEEIPIHRSAECKVGTDNAEIEFEVGPYCRDSVNP